MIYQTTSSYAAEAAFRTRTHTTRPIAPEINPQRASPSGNAETGQYENSCRAFYLIGAIHERKYLMRTLIGTPKTAPGICGFLARAYAHTAGFFLIYHYYIVINELQRFTKMPFLRHDS